MAGGFGMGVAPQAVGQAMSQAPPSDLHQDPLPLRSDPPRTYTPRPVDPQVEHSSTATNLAIAEALQRIQNGERTGEYQQPKSPLALMQMKRAGLSDAEIMILQHSTGQPAAPPMAAVDATAVQLRNPGNSPSPLSTMDRYGVSDVVRNLSSPGGR